MKDYSKGKIYRLTCNITKQNYYGSTITSLSKRRAKHTCHYKRWMEGKATYITAFEILKNENYDIILVENFSCNSIEELRARERHYIENNDCVNKRIPYRTKKECDKANKNLRKEYKKIYGEKHRDKINLRLREYYKNNKDKYSVRNKQNYEANKDIINQKRKEKILCECGREVRVDGLDRHLKTPIHLRNLEKNP